ncbi:MAG TPA: hypothetical protein VE913_00400 [Longimicrobium sp.]|nr:hypothetical protein [Longimicrobium sp.]
MKTLKRLAASSMLSIALVAATVQAAQAAVAIYECTLVAIIITAEGAGGLYECTLVAIIL